MARGLIVVVEDERSLREALAEALKKGGYTVLRARDGREGLALALQHHPDLIILDIIMPDINGRDMAVKLRSDNWGKDAKVMVLTNLKSEVKFMTDILGHGKPTYFVKVDTDLEDIVTEVGKQLG